MPQKAVKIPSKGLHERHGRKNWLLLPGDSSRGTALLLKVLDHPHIGADVPTTNRQVLAVGRRHGPSCRRSTFMGATHDEHENHPEGYVVSHVTAIPGCGRTNTMALPNSSPGRKIVRPSQPTRSHGRAHGQHLISRRSRSLQLSELPR
jgi:hypothetical protein